MPLDYDLEYGLRLKTTPEIQHKSLYDTAIVEVDVDGRDVGQDMIGWGWTQSFTAFDLAVSDRLSYENKNGIGRELPGRETLHSHFVHAKIRPGHPRQKDPFGTTTFRLFGTARVLKEITLDITPTATPADEGCTAWASASYESEVDFRREMQPDCLCFYLAVSQAVYDRYLWNITQGLVNEVTLSLGFVDGFYAEWNPGISTREIKVLAGEEHKVAGAEGVELARLGKIGKAELSMNAVGLIRPPKVQLDYEHVDDRQDVEEASEDRRPGFRWPGRR